MPAGTERIATRKHVESYPEAIGRAEIADSFRIAGYRIATLSRLSGSYQIAFG
jgi:hypothetical protein